MKKYPVSLLFFVILFSCKLHVLSQNTIELNGMWKCYENMQDTLKEPKSSFWIAFDGTTMQNFLSAGVSVPEPAGERTNYSFKNNILKTSQNGKPVKLKITVYHPNFISYTIPMNGKHETVYLKRGKKAS